MLAATTVETIVAIIGMLVPLAIAILQTLKQKQAARTVGSLWAALQTAAGFARNTLEPEELETQKETEQMQMLELGSQQALYQFVHSVISEYQAQMSPDLQKAKGLGGNGDWIKAFEKIIEKKVAS